MKNLSLALLFAFFVSLVPHGMEIYNYFKHQDIYFLDCKPFIQNPYGYFFGRLAKDFKRGEDVLRNFPEGGAKYDYPPLISVMCGTLSRLTGIDIEWLGFWLSPIFGSLFVVPFVLFWHRLGNLWVGFAGAVLTALSSAYYTRVFVLDLDTDNLNLMRLKDLTPKDAKILSWWDYGYAIVYYSKRTVFHDGGTQFSIKTPLVAYALLQEEKPPTNSFCASPTPFSIIVRGKNIKLLVFIKP
jgi:asparagine N-glycosylation enzyme membrane subunit Stt3